MKPNAGQLAMRDSALASLMGALPGANFGFDAGASPRGGGGFGHDSFAGEFSADPFGADDMGGFGADPFGADDYGADDMGAEPSKAALMALWKNRHAARRHTLRRKMILNPNHGSAEKIERYSFSLKQAIVLGTPSALSMTQLPATDIRPQRVVFNAPSMGFATIDSIEIANVNALIGDSEDAFTYTATAQNVVLDLPTMQPSTRARVTGSYSGLTPPPFTVGAGYTFVSTFQGPASITA